MTTIIAEIGFNHEGDLQTAVKMIQAAAGAGANAVKFQTFRAIDIALPSSPHFQNIQCGEMNAADHQVLYQAARDSGVEFLSTPFSPWAVDLLEKLGVAAYKVASMDATNRHLLRYVASTRKPLYVSTGMASLQEIADTLQFLASVGSGPVSILHCISKYPPEAADLNLKMIPMLKKLYQIPVGYSDHFPGTKACLAAAMLGADILETHFTLDSSRPGGDHSHSADPQSLRQLIEDINLCKEMFGSGAAVFNRPDRDLASVFRRGVYAARDLKKNEYIAETDLLTCRPVSALTPNNLEQLVGKPVAADVPAFSELRPEHIR